MAARPNRPTKLTPGAVSGAAQAAGWPTPTQNPHQKKNKPAPYHEHRASTNPTDTPMLITNAITKPKRRRNNLLRRLWKLITGA